MPTGAEWRKYFEKKKHNDVVKIANDIDRLDPKIKKEFVGLTSVAAIAEHVAAEKFHKHKMKDVS